MQNSPYAEYYNEAQKRNIQSVSLSPSRSADLDFVIHTTIFPFFQVSIIDKKAIVSHLSGNSGAQPTDAAAPGGKHPLPATPSADEPSSKRPRAEPSSAAPPKDVT